MNIPPITRGADLSARSTNLADGFRFGYLGLRSLLRSKKHLLPPLLIDPEKHVTWSDKDRFEIGKCAAVHGSWAAKRMYHTKNKPLNKTSARRFAKAYKEEIRKARKKIAMLTKV